MPGEQDLDTINQELIAGLDQALNAFVEARETEGTALKQLIEQRLAAVSREVATVRTEMPAVLRLAA